MKKFAFRTLGCKVNQYETEAMEELFIRRGYEKAEDTDEADVFVINTCTVTSASDAKSRQQINRTKKKNPQAIVAVVGCYSQVAPEEIQALDQVDLILGTKGRAKIVDYVEEIPQTGEKKTLVADLEDQREYDDLSIATELDMTRAYIKIQEGCDMYCSYCIIPYARGHIASRSLGPILEEAQRLADNNFKEVVLTGIHIASYGRDMEDKLDLLDVIKAIAKIEGIERIRLSSIEPRWVTEDRLKDLAQIDEFCDHFHLSLQSGSDQILKRMNRKYDTQVYREKVDLIRSYFPDCGITTDIIVGFPGESDKDFQDTVDFCKEIHFSKIHIFQYSPREGTPAADFEDQVSAQVKKKRAHALADLEEELRLEFLDQQVGKKAKVLFEEASKEGSTMEGYTSNYIRVLSPRNEAQINQVVQVDLIRRIDDKLYVE